jgi:hypothetical protein
MQSGAIGSATVPGRRCEMDGAPRDVRASGNARIVVAAAAIVRRRPVGAADRVVVGRVVAVVASPVAASRAGAARANERRTCQRESRRYFAAAAVEAISSTYVSTRTITNPRAR